MPPLFFSPSSIKGRNSQAKGSCTFQIRFGSTFTIYHIFCSLSCAFGLLLIRMHEHFEGRRPCGLQIKYTCSSLVTGNSLKISPRCTQNVLKTKGKQNKYELRYFYTLHTLWEVWSAWGCHCLFFLPADYWIVISALPKEGKDKLKSLSLSAVGHLERGNP